MQTDIIFPSCVKSIQETREDDLRETVLAETVKVMEYRVPGFVSVAFDFLCPNCGQRHWAEEHDGGDPLFSTVGWALKCGWVSVRMPWAQTPNRDKKSVYGRIDWYGERTAA